MATLDILDFSRAGSGLVVTRSEHYLRDRCGRDAGHLGVIVGLAFYEDQTGKAICWPEVHWEGAPSSSTCHPVNVVPHREHNLRTIQMNE